MNSGAFWKTNHNKEHWRMSILQIILLFFIYACLGWGCEVAFAACKQGVFVNRGFLNGPICPIYGFGVVGVVTLLQPIQHSLPLLLMGSIVLTSGIELITGWALEKLFHARWWDYTGMPLSIGGYVCLPFSILWGLACMVVVRGIHPVLASAVEHLPLWLLVALDAVFLTTFAVDLGATLSAIRKLSDRLTRLTEAAAELHSISDEIGQTISSTTLNAREHVIDAQSRGIEARAKLEDKQNHLKAWLDEHRAAAEARTVAMRDRVENALNRFNHVLDEKGLGQRRLLNAFPNLRSHRNQEAVEALRRFYEQHRPGRG